MSEELIYQPDLDWDHVGGGDPHLAVAFPMLLIVAYRTTRSETIDLTDRELIEAFRTNFGARVARDFDGQKLFEILTELEMLGLIRVEHDETLPSRHRLTLCVNPATGEKLWVPSLMTVINV